MFEGVKVMLQYIQSLDGQCSLVSALNDRFHIRNETATVYLCLLFLLLDNQEGETWKSKLRMEKTIICVSDACVQRPVAHRVVHPDALDGGRGRDQRRRLCKGSALPHVDSALSGVPGQVQECEQSDLGEGKREEGGNGLNGLCAELADQNERRHLDGEHHKANRDEHEHI